MFGFGRKGVNRAAESRPVDCSGDLEGPLFSALQYVSFVSPPNNPGDLTVAGVTRAHSPTRCVAGDQVGRSFLVDIHGGGAGKAYLFPTFGSVWVDGEAPPRAQIPTEMIAKQVPGYQEALGQLLKA